MPKKKSTQKENKLTRNVHEMRHNGIAGEKVNERRQVDEARP
jgi:hypothetical protein